MWLAKRGISVAAHGVCAHRAGGEKWHRGSALVWCEK